MQKIDKNATDEKDKEQKSITIIKTATVPNLFLITFWENGRVPSRRKGQRNIKRTFIMGRKKALSVSAMFLGINKAPGDVKSQRKRGLVKMEIH